MAGWKLVLFATFSVVLGSVGVMAGTTSKGRMIEIDAVVLVSPEKAFDLWTSADTAKRFFAPDATIDARVGGRYEMVFEPQKDPQGRDFGTLGCKILELDRGRHLSFQWRGPPWAMEMNAEPFPTRVDVTFEPAKGLANRTHLTLTHSGYGTGANWDKSYDFFVLGWRRVLNRFEAYTAALGVPTVPVARSDRHLEKTAIVNAPIEQVWSAWTTSKGMAAFFAPKSKIELAIGGAFELYIKPDSPEGSRGGEGCTVLSYQPMEMLSFSWNAPPSIPGLRDASIRTHVVLYFDDLHDGRVKLTLRHLGFGEGEDWDKCLAYFDSAWPHVLNSLMEKIGDVPPSAHTQTVPLVLHHEIDLPASIDEVWSVWTTSKGIVSWMTPRAHIDLRVGGTLTTNYHADAEPGDSSWIMSRILTYDPQRMLSIRTAKAPEGFAHGPSRKTVWTVVGFEPIGPDRTRVVLNEFGYGNDDASKAAIEFFDRGNAWTLKQLYKRFAAGEAVSEAPPEK